MSDQGTIALSIAAILWYAATRLLDRWANRHRKEHS